MQRLHERTSSVNMAPRPRIERIDDNRYRVTSRRSGQTYHVVITATGAACDCPAGRVGRHCYHAAHVWERYELDRMRAAIRPGDRVLVYYPSWSTSDGRWIPDREVWLSVTGVRDEDGQRVIYCREVCAPISIERVIDRRGKEA